MLFQICEVRMISPIGGMSRLFPFLQGTDTVMPPFLLSLTVDVQMAFDSIRPSKPRRTTTFRSTDPFLVCRSDSCRLPTATGGCHRVSTRRAEGDRGIFPPHQHQEIRYLLASTLQSVISQRLIPTSQGDGMVAAVEIMVSTGTIREAIINPEKTPLIVQAMREGVTQHKMQTFDQALM